MRRGRGPHSAILSRVDRKSNFKPPAPRGSLCGSSPRSASRRAALRPRCIPATSSASDRPCLTVTVVPLTATSQNLYESPSTYSKRRVDTNGLQNREVGEWKRDDRTGEKRPRHGRRTNGRIDGRRLIRESNRVVDQPHERWEPRNAGLGQLYAKHAGRTVQGPQGPGVEGDRRWAGMSIGLGRNSRDRATPIGIKPHLKRM